MSRVPPTLPAWLAGALALVLAQQAWWQVEGAGAGGVGWTPVTGVAATGGLAQALGLVALAGAAVTLVLRRVGRRAVGVLLAVTYAGVAALGFLHPRPTPDAVREVLGAASLADDWQLTATPWPWAYGAAGVLGVVAAGVLVARPVSDSSRSVRASAGRVEDSLASWKAMDEGLDPTE